MEALSRTSATTFRNRGMSHVAIHAHDASAERTCYMNKLETQEACACVGSFISLSYLRQMIAPLDALPTHCPRPPALQHATFSSE